MIHHNSRVNARMIAFARVIKYNYNCSRANFRKQAIQNFKFNNSFRYLLITGLFLGGQTLAMAQLKSKQGPWTAAEGKVTVTVVKGVNRFSTEHNISQPNDPAARRLGLTAALVFVAQ